MCVITNEQYDIRVSFVSRADRELCRGVLGLWEKIKLNIYMKTKRKVRRGKRTRRRRKAKIYKDYGEGLKYMIFDGKDYVFKYVGSLKIKDHK